MLTLEERVARLEARAEISDLAARYFLATDDDDYDTLAQCFTQNATFAASGFSGGSGREAIIEFLKEARSGMGQTVHTLHYVHVELIDDKNATGTVSAHLELGLGATTVLAAVRYYDAYCFEDGAWRISERSMRAVYVSPWSQLDRALVDSLNVRWPGAEPARSDLPRDFGHNDAIRS